MRSYDIFMPTFTQSVEAEEMYLDEDGKSASFMKKGRVIARYVGFLSIVETGSEGGEE